MEPFLLDLGTLKENNGRGLTDGATCVIFRNMSKYRDKEIRRFSEVFRALSNPNRLRMFLHLVSCCVPGSVHSIESEVEASACVGDLGKELNVVPSTVSHHIKELHRAGLIRMERRGQKIECWVDRKILEDLAGFFGGPLAG